MNKIFFIHLLLYSLPGFSQKISYTSNRLYSSPEYKYDIIGKMNNKIFIWQTNTNKHFESGIFVYNDEMNLLYNTRTNIFQSGIEPQPSFFVTANTFKVIYRYLKNNVLSYKLADFDESGTLISMLTLDSINDGGDALQPSFGYAVLQSANKKNIGFVKIGYDENNHALIFNCSFIDDKITNKDFAFSIDVTKEILAGINIDNDKNLLLVFKATTDSSTNLKLIRKNFSDNLMLMTIKTVNTTRFKDQSVYIVQTTAGYMVYGELNNPYAGLYVWQTDKLLNDLSADKIFDKPIDNTSMLSFVPSSNGMENIFAVRKANETDRTKKEELPDDGRKIRIPNYSNDPTYIVRYNNSTPEAIDMQRNQVQQMSMRSFRREKETYAQTMPAGNGKSFYEAPLKNIELFKIDSNNNVSWTAVVSDSLKDKTAFNLNNLKLIATGKALHLIYEVQIKNKPRSLNHIIIQKNGSLYESHFTAWNMKYQYLLNQSMLTNGNELIVPAIDGSLMKFAKIKIDQ